MKYPKRVYVFIVAKLVEFFEDKPDLTEKFIKSCGEDEIMLRDILNLH